MKKKKVFEFITSPLVSLFSKANLANVNLIERFRPISNIETIFGNLKFSCPNNMTLWRAKTFFTKEPDTIEWINNFQPEDIFYDIGANVGTYSVYAAVRGVKVISFEPESQNYAILNKNIYLNSVQEKIDALNIAISEESSIGYLYINEFTIGGALNNFGDNLNYKRERFSPEFKQAVASYRLDDLIESKKFPVPNHIKIDVDGLEASVINGALKVLDNPALKSILVELNTKLKDNMEIINILNKKNFLVKSRRCVTNIKNSEFIDIYNYIFCRA